MRVFIKKRLAQAFLAQKNRKKFNQDILGYIVIIKQQERILIRAFRLR